MLDDKPMVIDVGAQPVDGQLAVRVGYYEQYNGKGWSGEITVWVPESDSRAEIARAARAAAREFLQRALDAHSAEDPAKQSR